MRQMRTFCLFFLCLHSLWFQHLEGKSSAHADAVLQKTGDDIDLTRKFSISKKVNRWELCFDKMLLYY
jgi:hypothetical protein